MCLRRSSGNDLLCNLGDDGRTDKRQAVEERERRKGDQGDYRDGAMSEQNLQRSQNGRLTVYRLGDKPIQRQQSILDVFVLERSLEVGLVKSGLTEGLDDHDGVGDQSSEVSS